MVAFKIWGYVAFFLLISSQWLHIFATDDQQRQNQNKNQASKIPDEGALKPPWGTWAFPVPKPEEKKGHREGVRHGSECICNCNCDCEKTMCKEEGRNKGGPLVCLPVECDHIGCKFEGGMNVVEPGNSFHIPPFTVAGAGPQPQTRSSETVNTTAAGHL